MAILTREYHAQYTRVEKSDLLTGVHVASLTKTSDLKCWSNLKDVDV